MQVCDSHDPLTGVDKEKTDILMYCTGGIRCDVYSTVLRYYLKYVLPHYKYRLKCKVLPLPKNMCIN